MAEQEPESTSQVRVLFCCIYAEYSSVAIAVNKLDRVHVNAFVFKNN